MSRKDACPTSCQARVLTSFALQTAAQIGSDVELVVGGTESTRRIVQLSCQPFGHLP